MSWIKCWHAGKVWGQGYMVWSKKVLLMFACHDKLCGEFGVDISRHRPLLKTVWSHKLLHIYILGCQELYIMSWYDCWGEDNSEFKYSYINEINIIYLSHCIIGFFALWDSAIYRPSKLLSHIYISSSVIDSQKNNHMRNHDAHNNILDTLLYASD